MRQFRVRLFVVVAIALLGMDDTPGEIPTNAELLQSDMEWFRSMGTGSADAISKLLAEDFVGVTNVGRMLEKADWVRMFSGEWGRSLKKFSIRDRRVRLYDEIAIVTGEVEYARPNGRFRRIYTHVWKRVDAVWKLASLQETSMVPPGMK